MSPLKVDNFSIFQFKKRHDSKTLNKSEPKLELCLFVVVLRRVYEFTKIGKRLKLVPNGIWDRQTTVHLYVPFTEQSKPTCVC